MQTVSQLRRFINPFLALRSPRVQAVIRGDYPALIPTIGIISGELCANLGVAGIFCCLMLAFITLKRPGLTPFFIALLIGNGLIIQLGGTTNNSELIDQSSYLLKVKALPRYRHPGGVDLDLLALARIDKHPAYHLVALRDPQLISCRAVELPWRNIATVGYGQEFIARLKIKPLDQFELSPYRKALRRRGYTATCEISHSTVALTELDTVERVRSLLAQLVRKHVGDNETSGLFLGIALGLRDAISDKLEDAFKRTALAHLLVLSGYQITLVAFGVRALLRRAILILSHSGSFLIIADLSGLVAAVGLTILTGIESAALRAVVALSITLVAIGCDRHATLGGLTIATLLVTSILSPITPFDLSSVLTFSALLGITLGAARPTRLKFVGLLQILLFCSLSTSVVSAFYFKTFCACALLFNGIFAPLISLISCNLGIPALILTLIGCPFAASILKISAQFLKVCADVIEFLADSPLAAWELSQGGSLLVGCLLLAPLVFRFSRCLEYYLLSRANYPAR